MRARTPACEFSVPFLVWVTVDVMALTASSIVVKTCCLSIKTLPELPASQKLSLPVFCLLCVPVASTHRPVSWHIRHKQLPFLIPVMTCIGPLLLPSHHPFLPVKKWPSSLLCPCGSEDAFSCSSCFLAQERSRDLSRANQSPPLSLSSVNTG